MAITTADRQIWMNHGQFTLTGTQFTTTGGAQGAQVKFENCRVSSGTQNAAIYWIVLASSHSAQSFQTGPSGVPTGWVSRSFGTTQLRQIHGSGSGQGYYQVTAYFKPPAQLPYNNGGSKTYVVYVGEYSYQGFPLGQNTTLYRCSFQNYYQWQTAYSQVSASGSFTVQWQTAVSRYPYHTQGPVGNSIIELSSSQGQYSTQISGVANDNNTYYSTTQYSTTLNATQMSQTARGKTLSDHQGIRPITGANPVTGATQIYPPAAGSWEQNFIYSRAAHWGNVTSNSQLIQGNGSYWNGVYYRSLDTYNGWEVNVADNQISLNPTAITITSSQANSSNTQIYTTIGQVSGQNVYRFSTSNTSLTQWAGYTVNPSSGQQIVIDNGDSTFPTSGNKYFYLWSKNSRNSDSHFFLTNRSVIVSTSATDTTPDAPQLNPQSYSNAAAGSYKTASWVTQGVSSGVSVQWQVSGAGTPQLSTNNTQWSSSISRSQGQTGYVRLLAGAAGSTRTATVKFAQQTSIDDTFSVTVASGGQQQSQQGGQAQNYGLKILNSTGQATLIDGTSRIGTIVGTQQVAFQNSQSGPSSSGKNVFTTVDCSDENIIAILHDSTHYDSFFNPVVVTRRSAVQQGINIKIPNQLQQYDGSPSTAQVNVVLVRH